MKRMIPLLAALAATACTPETTAAPTTVTQTVTDSKTDSKTATTSRVAAEPQACSSVHVEAAVAPGEYPNPETWHTAVVVTNLGPDVCALEGASELRFFTGGDGRQLDVKQVMTDGAPEEPVVLAVSDQASMTVLVPTAPEAAADCLEGGAFVDVVLTGHDAASAEAPIPPVCGAVQVTPWSPGGAPGVEPN